MGALVPLESGPLVVFVHGWGARPQSYGEMLQLWQARGYSVVSLSLPGHGGSLLNPSWRDPLGCAVRDVVAQVRALPGVMERRRPVVLAGHSLGGAVVSLAARDLHGEGARVSVLLLSPAGAGPRFGPRDWVRAARSGAGSGSVGQSWAAWRRLLRAPVGVARLGWAGRVSDLRELWQELDGQGVTVTGVHAQRDGVVDSSALCGLSGVRSVVLPGCGHYWMMEFPELSASILEDHAAVVGASALAV